MTPKELIPYKAKLSHRLLKLKGYGHITYRMCCNNTIIFGAPGSGKTSSLKTLAKALLNSGSGFIILCHKNSEADRWEQYADESGRKQHFVRFDESAEFKINFMNYLDTLMGDAKGMLDQSLVSLLMVMNEAARTSNAQGNQGDQDAFFQDSVAELYSRSIPVLRHIYGSIRLKQLYQFIQSAPKFLEQLEDENWQRSFFAQTFLQLGDKAEAGDETAKKIIEDHGEYWFTQFPTHGDRLTGSIIATCTAGIYPFTYGLLSELFCTETTWTPEMARSGLITAIDLSPQRLGKGGLIAQQIIKHLTYIGLQHETVGKKTRFVALWCDEFQWFVNTHDALQLSTSREARIMPVYITQDLPTLYQQLGGKNTGEHATHALIAKFQNRFLFANSDPLTNEMLGSKVLGRVQKETLQHSKSKGANSGQSVNQGERDGSYGGGSGLSTGHGTNIASYQDYDVPPQFFTRELKTGGKENNAICEALLVLTAAKMGKEKTNRLKVRFKQS